jgi:flagellar hook assembly protein FlgD
MVRTADDDGDDATFAVDPSQQAVQLSITGANPGASSALRFSIPAAGHVSLKVYDVSGRLVRTLVNQDAAAGSFTQRWDGYGDDGARAGAGVYFVRLSAAGQTTDRKVVLQ